MYELVASAVNHPDQVNTLWGVFNYRSLAALSRAGVRVTAAVPRPRAPPVGPYSRFRDVPDHDGSFPYPVSHPRFWYYLPKSVFYHRSGDSMANALQQWRVSTDVEGDVFHACHLFPDGHALHSLADRESVPMTAYAHGTLVNEFEELNRPTRNRIRSVVRDVDCLFCSGRDVETKIGRIEPNANTTVVPIGADPDNFPTDREGRLRRELGVSREATVLLYCGRFTASKGVHDLVEAIRTLEDDSVYVVCIGHGGDLEADVRAALRESRAPPGRVLSDLHPVAVRRWFAVADLFVLPSYSEGRPTVIYEAMASETPAIGTTVGGVPEQIDDGETGWLVEPGDPDQLATTIRNALADDLEAMGGAAKEKLLLEGWTWESHAREMAAVHRSLLDTDD